MMRLGIGMALFAALAAHAATAESWIDQVEAVELAIREARFDDAEAGLAAMDPQTAPRWSDTLLPLARYRLLLGSLRSYQGRYQEAADALAFVPPVDHRTKWDPLGEVQVELGLYQQASHRSSRVGNQAIEIAPFLKGVGSYQRGHYSRALILLEEDAFPTWYKSTLEKLEASPVIILEWIALLHAEVGDPDQARSYLERARRLMAESVPEDHPDTARLGRAFARMQAAKGDRDAAREEATAALAIWEGHFGTVHPEVGRTHDVLGAIALASGDPKAAARHQLKAVRILEHSLGPEHAEVATALGRLGQVYIELPALGDAEVPLQRSLDLRGRIFPADHPEVAKGLEGLGRHATAQGDLASAQSLLERAHRIYQERFGKGHFATARAREALAAVSRQAASSP